MLYFERENFLIKRIFYIIISDANNLADYYTVSAYLFSNK